MTPEKNTEPTTQSDRHVLTDPLFLRRGSRVQHTEAPPPPKPEPVRRPAKVAQMLALAPHLQDAIDRRLIADRAAVARKLGLTRARVTHLLDLLMLTPDLQVAVLTRKAVDGAEPMAERTLRAVAHAGTWADQRAAWAGLAPALAGRERGPRSPEPTRASPASDHADLVQP